MACTQPIKLVGWSFSSAQWQTTRNGMKLLHKAGTRAAKFISIVGDKDSGKRFLASRLLRLEECDIDEPGLWMVGGWCAGWRCRGRPYTSPQSLPPDPLIA